MDYIIGAGRTAEIVRMFYPKARIIAPSKSSPPPLYYVWDSPFTRKWCKEFSIPYKKSTITNKMVFGKGSKKETIKLYNRITHKDPYSNPSEGKRKIKILSFDGNPFPSADPDLENSVREINTSEKTLSLNTGQDIAFDRVFWCANVDRVYFDSKEYDVVYHPVTFLKFSSQQDLFKSDYLYLMDKKYLNLGCYRVSKTKKQNGFTYSFEVTEDGNWKKAVQVIRDEFDIFFIGKQEVRSGHIEINGEKPKDIKDCLYFIGRPAMCEYEWLTSDTIKKLYKIRKEL